IARSLRPGARLRGLVRLLLRLLGRALLLIRERRARRDRRGAVADDRGARGRATHGCPRADPSGHRLHGAVRRNRRGLGRAVERRRWWDDGASTGAGTGLAVLSGAGGVPELSRAAGAAFGTSAPAVAARQHGRTARARPVTSNQ